MQTIIKYLKALKLNGALEYIESKKSQPELSFEEQLESLLEFELTHKKNLKVKRLLAQAQLNEHIVMDELKEDPIRGLDRSMFLKLLKLDFLKQKRNLLMTGATGCGKTYLANAIGTKACTEGYSVRFIKLPVFLEEFKLARELGLFKQTLTKMTNYDILILDDFGLTTNVSSASLNDLFNIIDARYQVKSTIIISQLPVSKWHTYLDNPGIADAILDRFLSQSERLELTGESLRWKKSIK